MRRLHPRPATLLLIGLAFLAACDPAGSDERKMRKKVVGEWAMEMSFNEFETREVLTLRPDSRWTRVYRTGGGPMEPREFTDSGGYRIQGVTLNLHSEVESGLPYRYTISGDTLYQANAAQVQAITGHDIGEQVLVRVR